MPALRAALLALLLWLPVTAAADGWVGPLTEHAVSPAELTLGSVPLAARIALARRLGRHGPQEGAVDALLAGLESRPPPELRDAILLSLARRASPRAVEPLARWLARDREVPVHTWTVLAAVADRAALEAVGAALEHPTQRAPAARALRLSGPAAVPVLAAALSGPAAGLAARSLERMGPVASGAVPALIVALTAGDAELRRAAARALGAIGDGRAAGAVLARLLALDEGASAEDLEPLGRALAVLATAAEAGPLLRAIERAGPARAALLLPALARADAARAAPVLARALQAGGARAAAAREALTASPHAAWLPVLRGELATAGAQAAASALRLLGVAGAHALLDAGADAPWPRALALALRAQPGLPVELRERGLRRLRALPPSPRRLVLRGLARDPQLSEALPAALSHQAPAMRAAAASAAQWLGDGSQAAALAGALARERDDEAFRRLASALRALGGRAGPAALAARFDDPATGPEALLLAASQPSAAGSRELGVRLRRLLASRRHPRLRVAAAGALALLGDRRAGVPLSAALADPSPEVRLAAARALSALAPERSRRELRSHARIEADARVRAAARALSAAPGAVPLHAPGEQVLEVRLSGPQVPTGPGPEVDVLLDDGRWLRVRPLWHGQLLVADLPPGRAQVRVLP